MQAKIDSNWSDVGSVHVFNADRLGPHETVYPDIQSAVAAHGYSTGYYNSKLPNHYGRLSHWVPDNFYTLKSGATYNRGGFWTQGDKILYRDSFGFLIPQWKLREVYLSLPVVTNHRWSRYHPYDHDRDFRNGPVPGIRRWRRYNGIRRKFQTSQERRENHFLDNYDEDAAEYNIKSRRKMSLPTLWDDINRDTRDEHCWKSCRKTRWKEPKLP